MNFKDDWFVKLKPDGSLFLPAAFVGPDKNPSNFGAKGLFATGQGEFLAVGSFNGLVNGTRIGVLNKFNAAFQPYTDQLLPFSRKGRVTNTAVDSAHRIIVVGDFNQYGEQAATERNYIARLMPDGSLDATFNANGANAYVGSVAVQKNGQVVVAGNFTELNGIKNKNIGRFNDNGSVNLSFNPGAGPYDGYMYDLHISPSQNIYLGGSFRRFDNVAHEGIVKLNANGSVDHSFSNVGIGNFGIASIIELADGKVLYGESSTQTVMTYDKPMRIYKVDAAGKPDPSFKPPVLDYAVTRKIRVGQQGAIYWQGMIFHPPGSRNSFDQLLVKLHPNGSLDSIAFRNLPANLFINDFEILPDQKIVIACQRIRQYDSLDIVMRLNPDLTIDSTFVPVSLLYHLQHINHDGNDRIIIAGEPKRAFRLENEQVQNIAIITKNGLELQANQSVIKNLLDSTAIPKTNVGATTDQVFTITNKGTTAIDLLDPATATVYGQHSTEFSIRPVTKISSLKPAESMQFAVRFSPASVGEKNAQVRIPFSDGIQQVYVVSVKASSQEAPVITAVEELSAEHGIRVFPNPVRGSTIHIKSKQPLSSYVIIDLAGRVVQKGVLSGLESYNIRIDKTFHGSFFLKINTGNKELLMKMIRI